MPDYSKHFSYISLLKFHKTHGRELLLSPPTAADKQPVLLRGHKQMLPAEVLYQESWVFLLSATVIRRFMCSAHRTIGMVTAFLLVC